MNLRPIPRVTGAPGADALDLADLKRHLRVDGLTSAGEDQALTLYLKAATLTAENWCRLALISQTLTAKLDAFPCSSVDAIELTPPVASVTHVKYIDTDGVEQTWASANYKLDSDSRPGRLLPAYNQSWPTARAEPNAVEVRWIAGFGAAAANVPEDLRQALLLICGHWYSNREAVVLGTIVAKVPWAAEMLLGRYKIPDLR